MARYSHRQAKGGCRCRFRRFSFSSSIFIVEKQIQTCKVIFRPYHTARTVINKTQRLLAHTYVIITKWLFDMPERDLCRHSSFADIDMGVMNISATGGKERQHSIHQITNTAPVNLSSSED